MKNKTRQLIIGAVILLTVLCLVFIFGNSLKDSTESKEQSNAVKEVLMSIANFFGFDGDINLSKLRNFAHIAEFGMLGSCLGALAMYLARRRADLLAARYAICISAAIGTGIVFAFLDELLQLGSAGRQCDIADVMLDTVGIIIGVALGSLAYLLFIKVIKSHKNKENDKIQKNT